MAGKQRIEFSDEGAAALYSYVDGRGALSGGWDLVVVWGRDCKARVKTSSVGDWLRGKRGVVIECPMGTVAEATVAFHFVTISVEGM
jgi:hypothetical protein